VEGKYVEDIRDRDILNVMRKLFVLWCLERGVNYKYVGEEMCGGYARHTCIKMCGENMTAV